jgi:hypothetical protein
MNAVVACSCKVRRDLAVLVSAPRHMVTLQDQRGGSDSDRQHDEPGIQPALAVAHETRLRPPIVGQDPNLVMAQSIEV